MTSKSISVTSFDTLSTDQLYKGLIQDSPSKKQNKKIKNKFWNHYKAILFRRFVLFKRSWKTTVLSSLASLLFTSLAILAQYLISSLSSESSNTITFNSFSAASDEILLVGTEEILDANEGLINSIKELYYEDVGRFPIFHNFTSREEMNSFIYSNIVNKTGVQSFPMGFDFVDNNITLIYNGSVPFGESNLTQPLYAETMLGRAKMKENNKSFTITFVTLMEKGLEKMFAVVGPMLISGGLISTIPMIISQPILDTSGEVRPYMVSCTLTLMPYWLAAFTCDLIIWLVTIFFIWLMFIACQVQAFIDNMEYMLYIFVACGPGYILQLYCLSFMFNSPNTATRNLFIGLCILYLVPIITDMIRNYEKNPLWYDWIMAAIPHMQFQRASMAVLENSGFMVQPFSKYWTDKNYQAYFIMQIVNIPLYSFILFIIEKLRLVAHSKEAKHQYGAYSDFIKTARKKHVISKETKEMEERVKNENDFAVKITNVTRLFFDTKGSPVVAVNGVSLGVKQNSIFGFLGANGAGKTTLIKMITGMLPPSDGTIEINGVNIEDHYDPTILSICPQFNNHLCQDMTAREHFKLYSMIYQLDENEAKEQTEQLLTSLNMNHFADSPLRELSGGDIRKITIALSFLGYAKIVLLDEPTASLDPVARHQVHDLILSYKGRKTFMLCTHLLSEAEFLCDYISIMVRGYVYTCGTCQYLTQKFGTDYKIDVMLSDDSPEIESKCDQFFKERLPSAKLTIRRPKARIYSIPAKERPLSQLFSIMQEAEDANIGITYFTCSVSSLERVFMEILQISENEDADFFDENL